MNELNWTDMTEYQRDHCCVNQKLSNKTLDIVSVEMIEYAKQHGLEFDGEYLYAYREHDSRGCGVYNKTIFYERGYYRDWRCDMRRENENSYGLGIFPKGNVQVRVKVDDLGCVIDRNDGKCRVWGFEIMGEKNAD